MGRSLHFRNSSVMGEFLRESLLEITCFLAGVLIIRGYDKGSPVKAALAVGKKS